jgi:uncharacterized protein (DUF58 family)
VTAAPAPEARPAQPAQPAAGPGPSAQPAAGPGPSAQPAAGPGPSARAAPPVTPPGLTWAPTAHYRRLATAALLPLLAAVVLGHPGYLVLAAPLVAALALAARRPRSSARVSVQPSTDRCLEGEQVVIRVSARSAGPADSAGVQLMPPAGLATSGGAATQVRGDGAIEAEWRLTAQQWGRWDSGRILVTLRSRGGLFASTAVLGLPEITVFPRPPALAQLVLPAQLRTRIGDHVDRQPADGIEFAGVRPFVPGDRLRRINWLVTSRRGALHVNQFAGERAAEIVALIDATADAGPPGDSALDRAVRGAAGIARAYTRAGDRVGVITLYGPMRWIAPGIGQRQFFRIVESVLDARTLYSYVSPDVARIPPTALPAGALVIMFSPLLDGRAIDAAIDLRERGYPIIVTDVLGTSPGPAGQAGPAGPAGPRRGPGGPGLALRLWRLERQALRYRLESLGIPVVGWPGEPRHDADPGADTGASLDLALGRFVRHRVRGGAR